MNKVVSKFIDTHSLSVEEYESLLNNITSDEKEVLRQEAVKLATSIYGNKIYARGLIEFSNYCKNNCYYCGIRNGNKNCDRYRLTKEQIYDCCDLGYELGFRTFVLQSGEDLFFNDDLMVEIISHIRSKFSDCAITISIGEKEKSTYQKYFNAGANRYLLRHETANKKLYETIHPKEMSFDNRMRCLQDLRDIGFQVGAGYMVECPHQTNYDLALDLKFVEEFKPEMCGIGPFIPHKDTDYKNQKAGTLEKTLLLLSITRIILPRVLLPATTALGTINPLGREMGVEHGANVVMPNLSPTEVRSKYLLYDNKICTGDEAAECKNCMSARMKRIGYELVIDRGDFKKE
ncbi:MAG: [Lachnospiraceae bacterium]|nr:[FeFe] hydrogenase H-cluster radical SAM maturase HydE [Lachnospiraceae bacterium]